MTAVETFVPCCAVLSEYQRTRKERRFRLLLDVVEVVGIVALK